MNIGPEWANILPRGPQIEARDGRRWRFDPHVIIAAFHANGGMLPVDYEHAQDIVAPKGEPAPASGWIVDLEDRDGALWARIIWTERAARQIGAREYRFLSGSLVLVDGEIIALAGAALVNRPALRVLPLDAEADDPELRKSHAAAALARKAAAYQREQAALGRNITIIEAVSSVQRQATVK